MAHHHIDFNYKPAHDGSSFTFRRFIDLIKKTRPPVVLLGFAVLFSVLTTVTGLAVPLFTKNLVDGFSLSTLEPSRIVLLGVAFYPVQWILHSGEAGIVPFLTPLVGVICFAFGYLIWHMGTCRWSGTGT